MLLTGCDHVRKDMFHHVGVKPVLKTFFDYSDTYKHMVQLSNLLIPDATAIRIPLVDERAAIDFISRVYHTRYAELVLTMSTAEATALASAALGSPRPADYRHSSREGP